MLEMENKVRGSMRPKLTFLAVVKLNQTRWGALSPHTNLTPLFKHK